MKIAIACDHIAFDLKTKIIEFLEEKRIQVIDCGCYSKVRTHYPIYGSYLGYLVGSGKVNGGIAICGTGVGITTSATKIRGVSAVLVNDIESVFWARRTVQMNVLGLGARITGEGLALAIVSKFINCLKITQSYSTPEEKEIIKKMSNLGYSKEITPTFFDDEIQKWVNGDYTNGQKQEMVDLPHEFKN